MVRNSSSYVGWKERKAVAADLKTIYRPATVVEAEQALGLFELAKTSLGRQLEFTTMRNSCR
jgi:transposase-like protein